MPDTPESCHFAKCFLPDTGDAPICLWGKSSFQETEVRILPDAIFGTIWTPVKQDKVGWREKKRKGGGTKKRQKRLVAGGKERGNGHLSPNDCITALFFFWTINVRRRNAKIMYHRNCVGIIFGRRNLYRGKEVVWVDLRKPCGLLGDYGLLLGNVVLRRGWGKTQTNTAGREGGRKEQRRRGGENKK